MARIGDWELVGSNLKNMKSGMIVPPWGWAAAGLSDIGAQLMQMQTPVGIAQQEQSPNQAFTRYLAQQPGAQGMTDPVRSLIEERGRYLSNLAPAYGYGIGKDFPGGQGMDFAPFYEGQNARGGGAPNWGSVRGRIGEIQGALHDSNLVQQVDEHQNPLFEKDATGANTDKPLWAPQSIYKNALAGTYGDQNEQLRLLGSGMALNVNPYFRSGLTGQLSRAFQQQQVLDPNTQFLDYAKGAGWW